MRRTAALLVTAGSVLAAPPAVAISPVGPAPDAVVGPRPTFQVTLGGGEESPRIALFRSLAAAGSGDGGFELTSEETPAGLRPYLPIEPGTWFWVPRAYQGSNKVSGEVRKMVVRRIVRMVVKSFTRDRATIRGSYVFATNAPRLIHRVEVFHDGKRVSRRQSRIAHSPSRRMAGESFGFSAALADNTPPFGSVHPGIWRVKVTIKSAGQADSASRRYVIR